MNRLDEIIVKVEEYLTNILNNEHLSEKAEKLRIRLIEEIELSRLPPSLPPRPEELKQLELNGNDFAASQRDKSRKLHANNTLHLVLDNEPGEFIPGQEYDDVDYSMEKPDKKQWNSCVEPKTPDLYEEPLKTGQHQARSDSDSGTSYESYDEFDDTDEEVDDNHIQESIQLPRVKSKKKKKTRPERSLSSLDNVTHTGDLYQRSGILQTMSKRLCVINGYELVVYKSETDVKPSLLLPLLGYEVTYMEKDGKYCHALKLSKTGCDIQWLFTDNKQIASTWIQHLIAACTGSSPPISNTDSGYHTDISFQQSRDSTLSSQSALSMQMSPNDAGQSSSEGGSGDGVISGVQSANTDTSSSKTKDKNVLSSIGNIIKNKTMGTIGTIGRKKGKGMTEVIEDDPDVLHAGNVMVMSEALTGTKKWIKCYCLIKNNTLECYKERGAETHDFCMALSGVDVEPGGLTGKFQLTFKLVQNGVTKLLLLPKSILEQGDWLNVLIKETGCGALHYKQQINATEDENIYNDVHDPEPEPEWDTLESNTTDIQQSTPPPLPKDPPPIRTPPSIKRIFPDQQCFESSPNKEPQSNAAYDDVVQEQQPAMDTSMYKNLESDNEQVNSVNEVEHYAERFVKDDTQQETSNVYDYVATDAPKKQVGDMIERYKKKLEKEALTSSYITVEADDRATCTDPNIVKSHAGPTIAEDKELLECTKNPLLSELKKGKAMKSCGDKEREKLDDQIRDTKNKIIELKKQRRDIVSRKNRSLRSEREHLEKQVQDIDKDVEEAEKQLTKFQVLAQEVSSPRSAQSSRSNSFNSGKNSSPVSRTNSFNTNSPLHSPKTTLRNTALKNKGSRSSPRGTPSKYQSSISLRVSGIDSKLQGKTTKPISKAATLPTTTQAKKTSPSDNCSSWNNDKTTKRTVTKQSTQKDGPSRTPTRWNPPSNTGTRQRSTPLHTRPTKQASVQEKLKLWESKCADSSTC